MAAQTQVPIADVLKPILAAFGIDPASVKECSADSNRIRITYIPNGNQIGAIAGINSAMTWVTATLYIDIDDVLTRR